MTDNACTGTRNAGFFGAIHCVPSAREAARRDEQMDVGMVEHRARPGVEDGETPEARADVTRVGGEALERRRRAAHQHAVDDALVRERERAQGRGRVKVTR